MMDQASIERALRKATEEVFSTMLGIQAVAVAARIETGEPGPNDGIIGMVGLAGAWIGTAVVCCSTSMACQMSAQMFGGEFTEVNEEVLDALSEITNMIVGHFKTQAEAHLGPLGLSIPTVIYGFRFTARTSGREKWVALSFDCAGEMVEVKICLTPNSALPRLGTAGYSRSSHN